jgi:hypothetical protein
MEVIKLHTCKQCGKKWYPRKRGTPRGVEDTCAPLRRLDQRILEALESGFILLLRQQTIKQFPASNRLRVVEILDLDPGKRITAGLGLADDSFPRGSPRPLAPPLGRVSWTDDRREGNHERWGLQFAPG